MSPASLLPLMAITLGDAAGVGPEIVLKAAADPETFRLCRPPAVGPATEVQLVPQNGHNQYEVGR